MHDKDKDKERSHILLTGIYCCWKQLIFKPFVKIFEQPNVQAIMKYVKNPKFPQIVIFTRGERQTDSVSTDEKCWISENRRKQFAESTLGREFFPLRKYFQIFTPYPRCLLYFSFENWKFRWILIWFPAKTSCQKQTHLNLGQLFSSLPFENDFYKSFRSFLKFLNDFQSFGVDC